MVGKDDISAIMTFIKELVLKKWMIGQYIVWVEII